MNSNIRKVRKDHATPPVLFEVVERRIVGTVHDGGGDKSPVEAGFTIAAEALANGIGGPDDTMQVEFKYLDHTFTARAEPIKVSGVQALTTDEIVDLARERGIGLTRDDSAISS